MILCVFKIKLLFQRILSLERHWITKCGIKTKFLLDLVAITLAAYRLLEYRKQ
jgi:hypothetical protein